MDAVGELLPGALRDSLQASIDGGLVPRGLVRALPLHWQPLLSTPEGLVTLALLALGALLALLLLSGGRGGKRGSGVVIAGPPNSGKTTLFFQLRDGSLHNGVVASMADNAATVTLQPPRGASKQAALLDVPGHHSARHRLEAALGDAAAVVFLVDAVEVTPHRTEAADLLYEVLSNPAVARRRVPILVVANKMDLELEAHSVEFIRKTLEKQLDAMRRTRTAAIGKDAGAAPALGAAGKPFSFAGLPNKVALAQASAKTGALEEVVAFIAAHV
ncbi:signal recognition particle receptor subunit beta-like [Raphidocelis subcapitata]|uniref:Signal recognition particle receptor subunit beta n=1 Tax=Raphidocelis subcapitata TaxID=307507 RepID=A0A2V0NVP9_9CHLO|nr:signal recognition particle receptor subunit beta-like [Raphidocelis subcapitata]|eukprot:GBF88895.1 signal recognition particle receptor subunit beta-like [Raphidocelis subcapitata]